MEELKPCPFCGGGARIWKGPDYFKVACAHQFDCAAQVGPYDTEAEAVAAWNRRAAPENKALTLEQLRQMDGEPVWVEYRAPIKVGKPWGARSEWMLVCDEIMHGNKSCVPFSRIGIDAQAYALRPEGAQKGERSSCVILAWF